MKIYLHQKSVPTPNVSDGYIFASQDKEYVLLLEELEKKMFVNNFNKILGIRTIVHLK